MLWPPTLFRVARGNCPLTRPMDSMINGTCTLATNFGSWLPFRDSCPDPHALFSDKRIYSMEQVLGSYPFPDHILSLHGLIDSNDHEPSGFFTILEIAALPIKLSPYDLWCRRQDLNLHGVAQRLLRPPRLPFPTRRRPNIFIIPPFSGFVNGFFRFFLSNLQAKPAFLPSERHLYSHSGHSRPNRG